MGKKTVGRATDLDKRNRFSAQLCSCMLPLWSLIKYFPKGTQERKGLLWLGVLRTVMAGEKT